MKKGSSKQAPKKALRKTDIESSVRNHIKNIQTAAFSVIKING